MRWRRRGPRTPRHGRRHQTIGRPRDRSGWPPRHLIILLSTHLRPPWTARQDLTVWADAPTPPYGPTDSCIWACRAQRCCRDHAGRAPHDFSYRCAAVSHSPSRGSLTRPEVMTTPSAPPLQLRLHSLDLRTHAGCPKFRSTHLKSVLFHQGRLSAVWVAGRFGTAEGADIHCGKCGR